MSKPVKYSQFYNFSHYLLPLRFGLGIAINTSEEGVTQGFILITTVFVAAALGISQFSVEIIYSFFKYYFFASGPGAASLRADIGNLLAFLT